MTPTERDRERARNILTPTNNWMLERAGFVHGEGRATLGRELDDGERVLVVKFDDIAAVDAYRASQPQGGSE